MNPAGVPVGPLRRREVLPRDGFQDLDFFLPTETKVEIITALWSAGLRWIEVTSMVHPKWVPQFTDAEEVLARARQIEGLQTAVFVPNRRGLDRALAVGVDEVSLAVAGTDKLSEANFGMDRAVATAEVVRTAAAARQAGADVSVTIGGAFGCPYEGDVAPARVAEMARALAGEGIPTILLADTIGSATVAGVERLFATVASSCPGIALGAHYHGGAAAIDNVAAAVANGASILDSAIGGYGGCPFVPHAPGNVPTEAVAAWLGQGASALAECAVEVHRIIEEARAHAQQN
ncbi:MAG: hydroxymethylglutaryl-CoA lyase [Actinomycetota bacterium]|nr:hydroxymethylglutaryl-CoA lyase [Actinomycetota bacterium]